VSSDLPSKIIRRLIISMVEVEKRGHIGPAMSLVEMLRVLYDSFLRYRANDPLWPDRDRLILSKGHGCLALYATLAYKGFFPRAELQTFCLPASRLGGHPEWRKLPGVEASTGALGHGLSIGVGMALAAKIRNQDYRVIVVTGDGELNEGSVWEAAMSAAKHKLSKLTVLVDHNKMQSYGATSDVLDMGPMSEKWRSFGFEVAEIDGHDVKALEQLVERLPLNHQKPTAVICHTIKGKGISFAEGQPDWHHKSGLKPEDIAAMYKCLE
jgi:transketolase